MSIEKYKKDAIQFHLSGIEKLKDGAKDWIACGESLSKIKAGLPRGSQNPHATLEIKHYETRKA